MLSLSPPKSASPQLQLEASKVLARLARIVELHSWISLVQTNDHDDVKLLYYTLALGKPLGVLLDLLGYPTSSTYYNDDGDGGPFSLQARERYIKTFIGNVKTLETQNKIGYGDMMRVEDLLGGGTTGFNRVRVFYPVSLL